MGLTECLRLTEDEVKSWLGDSHSAIYSKYTRAMTVREKNSVGVDSAMGLTEDEVISRRELFGMNQLPTKDKVFRV